ncbi:MAG: multicopper oxidase domain-containing protein [Anaerolineales bacterium]
MPKKLTRREFLKAGMLGLAGTLGAAASTRLLQPPQPPGPHDQHADHHGPHGMTMPVGEVDHTRNGFNPTDILTDFDYGHVSRLAGGQTLREYWVVSLNKTMEVMHGIDFPAWTFAPADEGWGNPRPRIPGPTFRATEGDRVRIHFFNGSDHPHSMHFHGIHMAEMDGVPGAGPGLIDPGQDFTYEFDAFPFGLHLYHCHAFPLARHIAKGLYGAFIIDPAQGRPAVDHEFVMVMAGYDVDFDDANDFYHVNGIPFHFQLNPIPIGVNETVRIYLVNTLEFDLINSFHLHANFFHHYPTGTSLTPRDYTDTIIQGQAERAILEFSYKYPGIYMFHAHVTEFAELGWAGHFDVQA